MGRMKGRLPTPDFKFTEEFVLRALNRNYLSNPKYLINGLFVFDWESDYLAKTTAGYWYEVEVKISLSDFKADFKKENKHKLLREHGWVGKFAVPNYFSYCVPAHLVEKVEPLVPAYAGLISVSEHGFLTWHKVPPKLHPVKLSDTDLRLVDKFYYNWAEEKRKNRDHDKIVRDLKGQIAFLKEEFKAVAGYSIDEEL